MYADRRSGIFCFTAMLYQMVRANGLGSAHPREIASHLAGVRDPLPPWGRRARDRSGTIGHHPALPRTSPGGV
jgi:hypothetical protein